MKYEEVGPWEELAENQQDAFQKALDNQPSKLGSYVAVYDSVFSEEECEKIIDFYKKSVALGFSYEGVSGIGGVNKDAKDSVDLQIFVAGNQPCPPYLHHEIDDEFYKWLQHTFKDRVMSCCYQYYTEVNTALMYESWYGIKPYLSRTRYRHRCSAGTVVTLTLTETKTEKDILRRAAPTREGEEQDERVAHALAHARHPMQQRRRVHRRLAFLAHDRLHLAREDAQQPAAADRLIGGESHVHAVGK